MSELVARPCGCVPILGSLGMVYYYYMRKIVGGGHVCVDLLKMGELVLIMTN